VKFRKRFRVKEEIPICSLPDIAFLLLIFFLVSTTMDMDRGIGLTLPTPGQTTEVPRGNICYVWVNAIGEIMCDGQMVNLSQLREKVQRRLSENEKLIISLETDPETEYGVFVDVLDELKLAGARRISIVSPEQSP